MWLKRVRRRGRKQPCGLQRQVWAQPSLACCVFLKDFDGKDGSVPPGRWGGSVSAVGHCFLVCYFRKPGVLQPQRWSRVTLVSSPAERGLCGPALMLASLSGGQPGYGAGHGRARPCLCQRHRGTARCPPHGEPWLGRWLGPNALQCDLLSSGMGKDRQCRIQQSRALFRDYSP